VGDDEPTSPDRRYAITPFFADHGSPGTTPGCSTTRANFLAGPDLGRSVVLPSSNRVDWSSPYKSRRGPRHAERPGRGAGRSGSATLGAMDNHPSMSPVADGPPEGRRKGSVRSSCVASCIVSTMAAGRAARRELRQHPQGVQPAPSLGDQRPRLPPPRARCGHPDVDVVQRVGVPRRPRPAAARHLGTPSRRPGGEQFRYFRPAARAVGNSKLLPPSPPAASGSTGGWLPSFREARDPAARRSAPCTRSRS